jgi:pilus assembly protein CpaC
MKRYKPFAAALLLFVTAWPVPRVFGQDAVQAAMASTSAPAQPAQPAAGQSASTSAPEQAAAAKSAATSAPQQPTPQAGGQSAATPAPQQPEKPAPAGVQAQPVPETTAPMRVMTNKSILINAAERLKRVSITDPAVADAVVVSPNQLMIHGRSPGEVTLVVWDEQDRSRSFDLRVDVDSTAAAQEIKQLMPTEQITVSASRSALILSGHVVDKDSADRAGAIAGAYSKNVINVLSFGPLGAQEILLEVRFIEIDRTALVQLGVNFLSTGATNTVGVSTTGQFGSFGNIDLKNSIGAPVTGFTTQFPNVDPLNLFLFRPDINLGVTIRLLQQRNLLQLLAEPNLIAVNGKEASFLAGGEFPVPVPQSGLAAGTITIQYKEFGVRLNFVPLIMPSGNIHMSVKPEVSSLDFTNALVLSGFRIPSLNTRRASTELELQDGQSFVIAGLLDNRLTNNLSRMPGIGNIPILGYFFRSKDFSKTRTELMVLVTAHRISPSSEKPKTPAMPTPFLDDHKFDNPKNWELMP